MAVERGWPLLLPLVIVICLFLILSWFGVFRVLPDAGRLLVLAALGLAALAALYPLRFWRRPSAEEVDRRIERANALVHEPVRVQSDRPSGKQNAFADALFRNPGSGNHWVELALEGRRSNRAAIGARLRVDVIENGKTRSIYRTVNSGGSFGANPLRQHIGVGSAAEVETIEVYWPTSDTTQTFHDVTVDRRYRILEGEASMRPFEVRAPGSA